MIQYKKLMMTLALLLTAATGAWAAEPELLVTIQSSDDPNFESGSKTFGEKATVTFSAAVSNTSSDGWSASNDISLTVTGANGYTITSCKFYTASGPGYTGYTIEGESPVVYFYDDYIYTAANQSGTQIGLYGVKKIEVYGYLAEAPITVEPVEGKTNEWTFSMPGSDVVLTPQYAPEAQWATEGDVELLPTAAEGVIAGTDAPLIVEGTVTTGQGTVMYFATTDATMTAEQAAQANGWLSTVPTAEAYDDATTVYVWYYIAGADTPDGQEPTDKNTFNDSEICATPIEVTVLSNEFDITFNAANANTIDATQASKGTVTVSGTDKTGDITEGKLKAVKMGQQVKMTAAQGYKFRKVEVKKGGAEVSITVGNVTLLVTGCTTWDQVIAKNSDKIRKSLSDDVETVDGFAFLRKGTDIVKITHTVDPNATDYNWYEM